MGILDRILRAGEGKKLKALQGMVPDINALEPAMQRLNAARPTAVNLAWALARMRRTLGEAGPDWREAIEREARAIETEDLAANRHMGALGAALIAQAHDFDHQVIANGAESALEHHLGMTCDPVAGFVQVPCIERCAFGAVKAWTGFMIASNEIPAHRRLDFDTTVDAMALTAKEMNSKYKETSEGGLAVSLVLC